MKRNILLLVHVEESFRDLFPDKMYIPRLIKSCRARKYVRVIHCTSHVMDNAPIPEVADLIDMEIDWGWGYEEECFMEGTEELDWVIESHYSLHDKTWVPPELRNGQLKGCVVWLGGGHAWECLADMVAILEYVGIEFYIVDGLTYGQ